MKWKLESERREALKENLGALIAVIAFVTLMFATAALPGFLSDPSSTVRLGSLGAQP